MLREPETYGLTANGLYGEQKAPYVASYFLAVTHIVVSLYAALDQDLTGGLFNNLDKYIPCITHVTFLPFGI